MKSLHENLPYGHTFRVVEVAIVAALMAMLSGCAAFGSHIPPPPPPPPPSVAPSFTITASARAAVGEVIPVEIIPPQTAVIGSVKVITAKFTAIEEDGTRVPALSPEEAATRAGDAGRLREAITDEGSAALVAKEVGLGPALGAGMVLLTGAEGGPLGTMVGVMAFPMVTSYSFYNGVRLATSSQQRLNAISYSESKFSYLTTSFLRTKVFIYFPQGHYRRLETALHLRLDGTKLESDQTVSQDWPTASQPTDSIARQ
jgi:hypothetical protein